MEISRFHSAIDQIANDYLGNKIDSEFTNLVNNLNTLVSNPGNVQISENFKNQLNAFRTSLIVSELNTAEGDLQQTLNDLKLKDHVGDGLYARIHIILEENQLTPNLAALEIEKLRVEISKKLNNIVKINNSFTDLQIEYSELQEGETEMLIRLPIEEETITLSEFSKETKEWYTICEAISETFDPQRTRVTIRTVGAGSVLFYLAATATFIYGVAKCLKAVNLVLAEVIRSKALYKELVQSSAPPSVLEPFQAHNLGKAKTDLSLISSNLVDEFYKGTDQARKHELKNSLSFALTKLSHKLATGSKISLRLSAPAAPNITEGEKPTAEQKTILNQIKEFEKAQVEVSSNLNMLDYQKHAADLVSALPPPVEEKIAAKSNTKTTAKSKGTGRAKKLT
jgi:hypothetical protein